MKSYTKNLIISIYFVFWIDLSFQANSEIDNVAITPILAVCKQEGVYLITCKRGIFDAFFPKSKRFWFGHTALLIVLEEEASVFSYETNGWTKYEAPSYLKRNYYREMVLQKLIITQEESFELKENLDILSKTEHYPFRFLIHFFVGEVCSTKAFKALRIIPIFNDIPDISFVTPKRLLELVQIKHIASKQILYTPIKKEKQQKFLQKFLLFFERRKLNLLAY